MGANVAEETVDHAVAELDFREVFGGDAVDECKGQGEADVDDEYGQRLRDTGEYPDSAGTSCHTTEGQPKDAGKDLRYLQARQGVFFWDCCRRCKASVL